MGLGYKGDLGWGSSFGWGVVAGKMRWDLGWQYLGGLLPPNVRGIGFASGFSYAL
jgi:hypothetical protein